MTASRPALERRILAALDASPSRIPVVLGDFRTGRTDLLYRLRERLGRTSCQHINVERCATTPERFFAAITADSPFRTVPRSEGATAKDAFDATLAFLDHARGGGSGPATFLLDEALELQTFESFPGLRTVLRDFLRVLGASGNRFVLTTRYIARAHRILRDATSRFEVIHVPPLTGPEVHDLLLAVSGTNGLQEMPRENTDSLVRAIQILSDGRVGYARAIGETMADMVEAQGVGDPVSALTALLSPDGRLAVSCEFCYELRLHRARGYGALKAILEILAREEPLTLTEIAHRLRRTPGSTKDYLSWLEDVDLIVSQRKRYSFGDPLLRVWVRLYCRPTNPSHEDVVREVHAYALSRLPQPEPAMALVHTGGGSTGMSDEDRKSWGIIEID